MLGSICPANSGFTQLVIIALNLLLISAIKTKIERVFSSIKLKVSPN
jgi:hypothetical protein